MIEIIVVDVGHGNGAILKSNGVCAVFDAAPGATLIENLRQMSIKVVDHVFLSHTDGDHVGGLTAILMSDYFKVKNLYLNPDSTKKGPHFTALRHAVDYSVTKNRTQIHFQHAGKHPVSIGQVEVKTLSPLASTAIAGNGGIDLNGARITSNNQSSIYLLCSEDKNIIAFTGDSDQTSLAVARGIQQDLVTSILVYPHHGGHVGGNISDESFAQEINSVFSPEYVIFSIGRRKFSNPLPVIINKLRELNPEVKFLCTQLSKNCCSNISDTLPQGYGDHLLPLPASSLNTGEYCAGSIRILFADGIIRVEGVRDHNDFVRNFVDNPLCGLFHSKN